MTIFRRIVVNICIFNRAPDMKVSSQYVALVRGSVDGQLESVAGYIWVGSVQKEQLHSVQVP